MKLTGDDIPVAAARRIALGAQGFAGRRPVGRIDVRRMRSAIGDAGVLQVDAVNVLTRAHYLPLFSRLGNYSRERLDQLSWGPKAELFEFFWAHKAALLPVSYFPLLRHRMRAAEQQDWSADLAPEITAPWSVVVGMRRLRAERPGFVEQVLATITEQGPLTAGQISPDDVRRKRSDPDPDPTTGSMWNWQDAKIAVEYLFCAGLVSIAGRRNFERLYDLTERVLPAAVLAASEPDDPQRELVKLAARGIGIGTAADLCGARGHYKLPTATGRRIIAELVESGELIPVHVEGITKQSYRWHEAVDRPVNARALLSPFDPLIWNRDRTQQYFDFFYRISIYTPAAERIHGYYVLPFLLGDNLVARVDLKADRSTSTLLVPTITPEPGAPDFTDPLHEELRLMADWLDLENISFSS
ncbi:winged helix-turn-helix domain-containing protein [Kribbella albertanoniae]|uniref:Winged helix-turn-helix domain-containing protein n=1 Tax=Kribbella albertanoniae TaxID=1266829 RepID=A0A4R4NWS0_9ACTN|nr:crosslink repair DNA glycosylase YcaQ family protein [Kribbella albertanoniae]TDC14268.1 winged helix-turn-helix domain-containing protein [Kribbella albertanoniae]